jgi:hypothetical protein
MIILNLIVSGKEEGEAMTRYLLKTKYAVQVILGNPSTLIEIDASGAEVCTDINNILLATKSVLFNELNENLKKEFPQANFCMYAAPAIHISTPLYDRIRSTVPGNLSLNM